MQFILQKTKLKTSKQKCKLNHKDKEMQGNGNACKNCFMTKIKKKIINY